MAEVANKYLRKTAHENKIAEPKLKCLCFLKLLAKQVDKPISNSCGYNLPSSKIWTTPFDSNKAFQHIIKHVKKQDEGDTYFKTSGTCCWLAGLLQDDSYSNRN